jgi:ribosomal protein S15P/S13E
MSLRRKQGRDFLLGILAGAIGLAAVWHLHPEWHDNGSAALEAAWQRRELLQSAAQPARPVQPVAAPGSAVGAEEAGLAHGSLVRGDPELAQLDKDLDRLRAQAESVTSHPSALRRDVASARAQRDACGDRACLLRWYAHRREQLLAAF